MASLRGVRRRVCGKKVKYTDEADAKKAAQRVSRKTGEWFRAYRCPWGGHWHLGHPPADIVRKISAKTSEQK